MVLIRVFRLFSAATSALILMISGGHAGDIGRISEQTKPSSIAREGKSVVGDVGVGVQMNDTLLTTNGTSRLKFVDDTSVFVTENSRLLIDNFVYDSNRKSGKIGLKVALGTVKYTSGAIAKTNPGGVDIQTPTASIAVRGTDFSMTVDELGKSTIILLPSCSNNICVTGAIEVATDQGFVVLNKSYQATTVSSRSLPPSEPKTIKIADENINNNLIIVPPKELTQDTNSNKERLGTNLTFLDVDYLKYDKLNVDLLANQNVFTSELDINRLNVDFLGNLLDIQTANFLASSLENKNNGPVSDLQKFKNVQAVINDYNITLYTETSAGIASVKVDRNMSGNVNIYNQDNPQNMKINNGGSYQVTIKQSNR